MLSILVSVLFLLAFVLNLIFGKGIGSGWDWLSGLAFGLAVTNIAKHLERKNCKARNFKALAVLYILKTC